MQIQWDLFCRVIDNHGDVGVCWRLAADLASRGKQVRLWMDDASALRWMAPQGAVGVSVRPWPTEPTGDMPGDVVIEAFGCELPPWFVQRMAAADEPPAWINLEYLSAEDYVERSHALLSPQQNGLRKWFFYPGFTPRTGGLLRRAGPVGAPARFRCRGLAGRPRPAQCAGRTTWSACSATRRRRCRRCSMACPSSQRICWSHPAMQRTR